MSKDLRRYRKQVIQKLECGYAAKRGAVEKLNGMIELLDTEPRNLTQRELMEALGHPEEVARSLMDNVPEADVRNFRIRRIVRKCCAAVLAIALLASAVYVFFYKEIPIEDYDFIIENQITEPT